MTGCAAAIKAAILRELDARASHVDTADDIGEVTITVSLNAGTTWVRGVTYSEERIYRRNAVRAVERP